MRTTVLSALASLLLATSPLAHAERWLVKEGQRGDWQGTWVLKASSGNFALNLRSGNASVTAEGFYIRSGNTVSIARSKTSDGNDCHYMGQINGRMVTGTAFCSSGGPYGWTAEILPDEISPRDVGLNRTN
jgi:hypothetical protein